MQPILRYSRSGAAWVCQPTTLLPGRTYARRVGEWRRTARIGNGGRSVPRVRPRPGGGGLGCFSQIPQIRKSAGQSAGISCWCDTPQPPSPLLISPGIIRLSAALSGPTSTTTEPEAPPDRVARFCISTLLQRTAELYRTQGTPACFFRISCARQGKEQTPQSVQAPPVFSNTCLGRPAVISARAARNRRGYRPLVD